MRVAGVNEDEDTPIGYPADVSNENPLRSRNCSPRPPPAPAPMPYANPIEIAARIEGSGKGIAERWKNCIDIENKIYCNLKNAYHSRMLR